MKCICCRTLISHRLDTRKRDLPAWVSRHIERCDACRNHYFSCKAMEDRLHEDRSEEAPAFTRELARRVMAVVRKSDNESPNLPIRPNSRILRPVIIHAATVALIAVLLILHPSTNKPAVDKPLTTAMNDLSTIGKKMMDRYMPIERKNDWFATLSDPLHEEVDRLTKDAEALKRAIAEFAPLSAIIAKAGRMKNRTPSFD